MTSQRVERTWIRTGGYRQFRGEWVKLDSVLIYVMGKCIHISFPWQQTAKITRTANWVVAWHYWMWWQQIKNLICSYVSTEVYWYRKLLLSLKKEYAHLNNIVSKNSVENRERRETHSHFYCLSLSQWLNPSPSAVNPIFSVHKKANPNSHFTLLRLFLGRLI